MKQAMTTDQKVGQVLQLIAQRDELRAEADRRGHSQGSHGAHVEWMISPSRRMAEHSRYANETAALRQKAGDLLVQIEQVIRNS